MVDYFRIGVVSTAHGIKGELKVFATCDDPARFKCLKRVFLSKNSEEMQAEKLYEVESARLASDAVLLKLKGVDDRNASELLRGYSIWVERADAVALAEDEFFIADFIGARVVTDEGEELGTVSDIFDTGANQVISVATPVGGELLIPLIKEFVLSWDATVPVMYVHLLPGLR